MEMEKPDFQKKRKVDLSTLITSLLFIVTPLVFFYLLSQQSEKNFGLREISFSLALSISIILILVWIKKMIVKNPYLGLSIGLSVLTVSIYSLYLRFKGAYTNAFAIISGFIVLIFLLFNFFRYKT